MSGARPVAAVAIVGALVVGAWLLDPGRGKDGPGLGMRAPEPAPPQRAVTLADVDSKIGAPRVAGRVEGGLAGTVGLSIVDAEAERPVTGASASDADSGAQLARSGPGGLMDVQVDAVAQGLLIEAEGFATRFLDRSRLDLCPLVEGRRVVELTARGFLTVRVESEEGERLGGVEVWIGSESARSARFDARAAASIEHLDVGTWSRSLARKRRIPLAAFVGTTDASGSMGVPEVPLRANLFAVARSDHLFERRSFVLETESEELVIHAVVGRELTGRLVWDDGTPLEGAWIRLFDSNQMEETTLAAGGRFHFRRVRSDKARLEVLKPIPFETVIDVAACGGEAPDIVLPRSGPVAGRLLFDGPCAEDWWVECWQGSELAGTAYVSDCVFELTVPAGPCRLLFRSTQAWPAPVVLRHDCTAPVEDLEIDVRGLLPAVRLRIPELPAGTSVVLYEHQPTDHEPGFGSRRTWAQRDVDVGPGGVVERHHVPPGARAWLVDAGDRGAAWTGMVQVAAQGTTEIGPLDVGFGRFERPPEDRGGEMVLVSPVLEPRRVSRPGPESQTYEVRAGPWSVVPRAAGGRVEPGAWIEVLPGSVHAIDGGADLGALHGIVLCGSEPRPGLSVSFRDGLAVLEDVGQTRTDEQGRFTVEAVQPGPVRLRVSDAEGRTRAIERFEVPAGRTSEVEVQLGTPETGTLVRILRGGEPVRDVECVWAAPWPGERSRACTDVGDGLWRVEGLAGRTLFAVRTTTTRHTGGHYHDAFLFGEAEIDSPREEVEIYTGVLRVELPDEPGIPEPVGFLEEVEGLDPDLLYRGWQPLLPRRAGEGRVLELHSVPPRCRIRLLGLATSGVPREQLVLFVGESSLTVEWKP